MGNLEIEIFTAVASFQNIEKNTDALELIAGVRFWIFRISEKSREGGISGGICSQRLDSVFLGGLK